MDYDWPKFWIDRCIESVQVLGAFDRVATGHRQMIEAGVQVGGEHFAELVLQEVLQRFQRQRLGAGLQRDEGLIVSDVAGAFEVENAAMDGVAIVTWGDIVNDADGGIENHFEVLRFGLEAEGEDLEVFEADFDEALAMIARGEIVTVEGRYGIRVAEIASQARGSGVERRS